MDINKFSEECLKWLDDYSKEINLTALEKLTAQIIFINWIYYLSSIRNSDEIRQRLINIDKG